jgi:hypothetical protein
MSPVAAVVSQMPSGPVLITVAFCGPVPGAISWTSARAAIGA